MTDAFDRELKVGDLIVHVGQGYSSSSILMYQHIVVGFTNTRVRIETNTFVSPDRCIKVDEDMWTLDSDKIHALAEIRQQLKGIS